MKPMNYCNVKLIAGYTSASAIAVSAAYLLVCELGGHPALSLHGNLFG